MNAIAFGLTDVGRRREANQDQFVVDTMRKLYAVADGMGGHAAGEVASMIAIQTLAETLRRSGPPPGSGVEDAGAWLDQAVHEGNRRICESVLAREEWRGMGTTLVVLLLLDDRAVVGHVGDSRAYRLRGRQMDRLTADHSWVGEQVKLGLLSEAEASRHPMRNIVTRALGNRMDVQVELTEHEVQAGDVFLLCSDGLTSMLPDEEILPILSRHAGDPEAACRALVDRANERGGEDNITVIVVAADGERIAAGGDAK